MMKRQFMPLRNGVTGLPHVTVRYRKRRPGAALGRR